MRSTILRGGWAGRVPDRDGLRARRRRDEPRRTRRLYAVKGRPRDHPVIVHLAGADRLDEWAVDVAARRARARGRVLARPAHARRAPRRRSCRTRRPVASTPSGCASRTTRSRSRCSPRSAAALAAPSANRFGRVSPTTADAVRAELGDDVPLVLDGGPSAVGVESTIVDCTATRPRVLRVGGVTVRGARRVPRDRACPSAARRAAPGHPGLALRTRGAGRGRDADDDELARASGDLVDAGERVGVLALRSARAAGTLGRRDVGHTRRRGGVRARVCTRALREADVLGLDVVLAVPPDVDRDRAGGRRSAPTRRDAPLA